MSVSSTVTDARPAARAVRLALLVTTGFMALQAFYGAALLVRGGPTLPDPPDILPGDGWGFGAVALLLLVAAPMAVACALQVRHHPRAPLASLLVGLVLVGWIVVQVAMIGLVWFIQPLCLVIGALVAFGGWWQLRAPAQ